MMGAGPGACSRTSLAPWQSSSARAPHGPPLRRSGILAAHAQRRPTQDHCRDRVYLASATQAGAIITLLHQHAEGRLARYAHPGLSGERATLLLVRVFPAEDVGRG